MKNFSDIFKSSFLETATAFTTFDVVLAMGLALIIGLFILLIYKKTYAGVMYSSAFGVSIVAMSLVTTLIILAVTSNVVLSLGMVGALSIVRFRTAVKEPLDIAYIFWALSVGIVIGAGLFTLAIIGSIFIGITLLVLVNTKTNNTPYIVVLNLDNYEAEKEALNLIKKDTKKSVVKAKTVSKHGIDITVEVRLLDESATIVNNLLNIYGVNSATLVSYNGDYVQ